MQPLDLAMIARIAEALTADAGRVAARDRAVILLGFATALRRSNISALTLDDIAFCREGITVRVRKEKQDQEGKGRIVGIPRGANRHTCPLIALESWLDVRGREPGPLFVRMDRSRVHRPLVTLAPQGVLGLVKRNIAKIGIDATEYGAHSLRAGFVTEALEKGVGEIRVANHTGHRSLSTLRRYFRPRDLFKANACAALGL